MNYKITFFILFLITTIFIFQSASAIIVYLRPAKMIIRVNTTSTQPAIVERSLVVKNENNFTLNVELRPEGDIWDITTMKERNITLGPGGKRDVNFTITINEPKTYNGKITVIYSAPNITGVALQAEILIIASGEKVITTTVNPSTGKFILGQSLTNIGIISVVIVILILLVYKFARR